MLQPAGVSLALLAALIGHELMTQFTLGRISTWSFESSTQTVNEWLCLLVMRTVCLPSSDNYARSEHACMPLSSSKSAAVHTSQPPCTTPGRVVSYVHNHCEHSAQAPQRRQLAFARPCMHRIIPFLHGICNHYMTSRRAPGPQHSSDPGKSRASRRTHHTTNAWVAGSQRCSAAAGVALYIRWHVGRTRQAGALHGASWRACACLARPWHAVERLDGALCTEA